MSWSGDAGTPGEGALYPSLSPGRSGLKERSYALIDQVRFVDKRRVQRVFGTVAPDELRAIDEGILLFLGLTGQTVDRSRSGETEAR